MALSNKQKKFIKEYLQCFNATEAARRAGYSERTARSIGSENLTKPDIASEIKKALRETAMSADEALMHLGTIARGAISPAIFFITETITEIDKDGNKIEISRTTLDWNLVDKYGYLIKSISFTANGPRLELYDRLKALELIARHHDLFDTPGSNEDKPFVIKVIKGVSMDDL